MTNSAIVTLADAVTAALNTALSGVAVATTTFAPIVDLERISTSRVICVIPFADSERLVGGVARFSGEFEVDCILYARVGAGVAAEAACRPLMNLRQQIRDTLKTPLAVTGATAPAILLANESQPSFDSAGMIQKDVFVSNQTLKFSVST